MSTVLVTGGTGFLGEHLCGALIEAGYAVRMLARSSSIDLERLGVECIRGSVLSAEDVAAAVSGCDGVFHLAGMVSRDPGDSQRMMRLHVDGTRIVFETAKAASVPRIVVASSSGTIAVSEAAIVFDESADYATETAARWPYYASKIYQEKLSFELGERFGIEVVVVNPSMLLGPGDRRLSSSEDVLRFMRGQIPVVPPGGVNFVDVRDAAAATLAAFEKGKAGERYLLGGPNWTCKEFFGRLERVAKVRGPRLRLPRVVSEASAGVLEHFYRKRGKQPPIDRQSVEMGHHFWYVNSAKAERELGFEQRDPSLTLTDTVKYIRHSIDSKL